MPATTEKPQRATKPSHTPLRNFRASDEVWAPAMARAKANGETLTDVLVRALAEYGRATEAGPQGVVEGSLSSDAADLVELHAAAVTADHHAGEETTRATVEASLAAHKELTDACEAFRRRYYPRAGRVVAAFGEVFTVSAGGRRVVCVYSERDRD